MSLEGGCYCGALRFEAAGKPALKAQCHCRECQYITGGAPNLFMLMPLAGFRYTRGTPALFTRDDLDAPVTREFCGTCGTHMVTRRLDMDSTLVLKIGTLDDPTVFDHPRMAIFTVDQQPFHHVPDGVPTFERMPRPG